MQDNDIRITLKTLSALGNIDAIKQIRDTLKRDYEYANSLLGLGKDDFVGVLVEREKKETSSKPKVYNKGWSNPEKFVFLLKNRGRFTKFRDIAEEIVELEGQGDIDYLTRRLTASTRSLKLEGKIVKVSTGGHRNTFWGLSKWLNEDGSIKEGYEYDENSVKTLRRNKKESSGILDDL